MTIEGPHRQRQPSRSSPFPEETSTLIVEALPLWDRILTCPHDEVRPERQEDAEQLWQLWSESLGDASGQTLARRLEWSAWDPARVRAALVSDHVPDLLLNWVSILGEVTDECRSPQDPLTEALPVDPASPIPFEELLLPFVRIARRRLRRRFPSASGLAPLACLSERAYLELERALLVQLANMSGLALIHELDESLATVRRTVLKLLGAVAGDPPRDGYVAFVRKHLGAGWSEIFSRYPVMARLFGTAIGLWVDASEEFLRRFSRDWPDLGQDRVEQLIPGRSDPHNGNRTVIVLELTSGRKLVYKPKDLALEAAFNDLLAWCNRQGVEPQFRVSTVRCCSGYGWSEHVEQLPCIDDLAARRYYRRAGTLLAVLYVLQATDCHRENLIAHGEHPILIDMETLLYPTPRAFHRSAGLEQATSELRGFLGSVIGTGLLPRWDVNLETHVAFDISALGCVEAPPTPTKVPRISNVNTDDMLVVHEHVSQPLEKNVPMLEGIPLFPDQYIEDVCDGFATAYRLLRREREALVAPDGPLVRFKGLQARYLFRNTRVYHYLLGLSYYPHALRSGTARSIGFDRLAANTQGLASTDAWPILQWELNALENLDVPCFTRRSDGVSLHARDGETIDGFFEQSGYDKVLALAGRLDESDLAYQQAIIRGSLLARRAIGRSSADAHGDQAVAPDPPLLSSKGMLEEAVRLGDEILERAHHQPDGRLTWLGFSYVDMVERFQLQPIGENLYEGKAGVAIFLAALGTVTGESRFVEAAANALQLARGLWRDDPLIYNRITDPDSMGIGGIAGVGSLAYALATAAALLQDQSLLVDAVGTTRLIAAECVGRDRELDVMSGAAGALLCILSVYARVPDPELLQQAMACGEHLLRQRAPAGTGLLAWRREGQPALTGFSHGAAGIGLSLARLYQATGDERYLDGAQSALAFERAHFSEKDGNWPDLRGARDSTALPHFMTSWCHGAPGIGLSRIACSELLDDGRLPAEISAATETALNHSLADLDHLCCGNFGRLELLAWSASRDPRIHSRLASSLAQIVDGAMRRGGYRLFHNLPPGAWNPGFFRGTAGIGYSLLRQVAPGRLPNVLMLD